MNKKMLSIILAVVTGMMLFSVTSFASECRTIMNFRIVPKVGVSGTTSTVQFPLDNINVRLEPEITNKVVKLVDYTGNTVQTFPLEKYPYFHAYKIQLNNGKEALLVVSGQQAVSDCVITDFWLVGKYKDKFVTFSRLENASNSGLVFQGLEVFTETNTGELWIQGVARDRDCRSGYYKGHKAVPSKTYKAYCAINAVSYFWDDASEWFGIKYQDNPIP